MVTNADRKGYAMHLTTWFRPHRRFAAGLLRRRVRYLRAVKAAAILIVMGEIAGIVSAPSAFATPSPGDSVNYGTVPAIAGFNGENFYCWIDSSGLVNFVDFAGRISNTYGALNGCSAAGFGGSEYYAWTDDSTGAVDYGQAASASGLVDQIPIWNAFSVAGPALAKAGNDLYVAWTGTDLRLNVRDITTGRQATFESSRLAPALNGGGGGLNIAWTGTNGHLNVAGLNSSLQETCKQTFRQTTYFAPGLTNLGGRAYLSWAGEDSARHINLIADRSLTNTCDFADTSAPLGKSFLANTTPGLGPLNGHIQIIWGGTDKNITLNVAQV
jgi:hypothetical protein